MQLGSVSDAASESLARVREERRENASALRTLMNDMMRGLFEKGASDSKSVTLMRDRYCVGIKVRVTARVRVRVTARVRVRGTARVRVTGT